MVLLDKYDGISRIKNWCLCIVLVLYVINIIFNVEEGKKGGGGCIIGMWVYVIKFYLYVCLNVWKGKNDIECIKCLCIFNCLVDIILILFIKILVWW